VAIEQQGEIVFMDERIASLEGIDLALIVVDTDDRVPHLRETDRSDEAYISRAHDGKFDRLAHMPGWYTYALTIRETEESYKPEFDKDMRTGSDWKGSFKHPTRRH
jgi:hypothetical protein